MNKTMAALTLTLILGACSTQTVFVNGNYGILKKDEMQPFFISGIGQTQTLNAAAICGSAANVAKVEREESLLNGLLRLLTFGMYTPYDAKVYCLR